ncbi:hypothetical protein BH11MYX1_BH11MYX1_18850 [soil metagenome]
MIAVNVPAAGSRTEAPEICLVMPSRTRWISGHGVALNELTTRDIAAVCETHMATHPRTKGDPQESDLRAASWPSARQHRPGSDPGVRLRNERFGTPAPGRSGYVWGSHQL